MNEVLNTIAKRYSCREFTDAPLTDDQVQALIQAALASPSAMNRQPWHVTAITDKAMIDEMDQEGMRILKEEGDPAAYERMMSRGGKLFYNTPCMIVVSADGSDFAPLDCGILSQNVALATVSMGLGSLICGMVRIPLNGPRGKEWKERMGFPAGYDFGMGILAGTASAGKPPHEKDMSKVTYVK